MVELVDLPAELLCLILRHLPVQTLLQLSPLCHILNNAVSLHLQRCRKLQLCLLGQSLPPSIADNHLVALLKRCPQLETLRGLHPVNIFPRPARGMAPSLTVPGVIDALAHCPNLQAVETNSLSLVEALLQKKPHIYIMGHFFNSEGSIPPQNCHRFHISSNPNINSLNLTGVEIPELVEMQRVQQLDLNYVRFVKPQPFQKFACPNLRIFTMRHCQGPQQGLRYLPLVIALADAPNLFRLELNSVPLLGGLVQRSVENMWTTGGFCNLKSLTIAGCKKMLESDIGYLVTTSSEKLETLNIEPQLAKDSLFHCLFFAHSKMSNLRTLHLGYVDPSPGWGELEEHDGPTLVSDLGLNMVGKLSPGLRSLWLEDCPHLLRPSPEPFIQLTDLMLVHCLCLQPEPLAHLVNSLPNLKSLILNKMLYSRPRGATTGTQRLVSQTQDRRSICIHFGTHSSDHLALKITSASLISLTVISCGMTDLNIDNCPQLMHLELEGLLNLNQIQLVSSPSLSRINILQCPQLKNSALLNAVLSFPARRARFVFMEPQPEQIPTLRELETELFDHELASHHSLCLFQEITPFSSTNPLWRENMLVWLRLANRLVTVFCKKMEVDNRESPTPSFIREEDLMLVEGPLPEGSFKVKTTIPWLRQLWKIDDHSSDLKNVEMPIVESFGSKHYAECGGVVEGPMAQRYPDLHLSQVCFYLHLPSLDLTTTGEDGQDITEGCR